MIVKRQRPRTKVPIPPPIPVAIRDPNRILDLALTSNCKIPLRSNKMRRRVLVEMMADPTKKFSVKQYSERFGVPPPTVRSWMRNPRVQKAIKHRIKKLLGGGVVLSMIYKTMLQEARRGSFKHQQLLLEITGEYQPNLKIRPDFGDSPEARFRALENQRTNAVAQLTAGS